MNSMNFEFGDVTKRRSPTFSDCHYVMEIILFIIIAYFLCFQIFGSLLKEYIICYCCVMISVPIYG